MEKSPSSVNKLQNLRNMNVSSTSAARKSVFQGPGQQDHTGHDLPDTLDENLILPIDGAALNDPLPSTDPSILATSSQIINKLEIASGKVEALAADTVEAPLANKESEEELSASATIVEPATTTLPGASTENRLKAAKGGAGVLAKKTKN